MPLAVSAIFSSIDLLLRMTPPELAGITGLTTPAATGSRVQAQSAS
jgi:hypothetical protein